MTEIKDILTAAKLIEELREELLFGNVADTVCTGTAQEQYYLQMLNHLSLAHQSARLTILKG